MVFQNVVKKELMRIPVNNFNSKKTTITKIKNFKYAIKRI